MLGVTLQDRYVLEKMIGEGAMGRVYLAHHTRMSKRFAIKIMFGDLAAQAQMRARFTMEAEAASRLDHENLVSVVDFGETQDGLLFLAMEFIEGRDLQAIVDEEEALAPERVIALARSLARGLRHLHARGLIHRDLKLENIVVIDDGDREVPKIVDFGVALLPNDDASNKRLTKQGTIVGTLSFMAPEQAFSEPVDERADLFSLGIVLYHLLAGVGPFDGTAFEVIEQIVSQPIPRFAARNPRTQVPPGLEAIVIRLTARHPGERFGSAQALINALDALDGSARLARKRSSSSLIVDGHRGQTNRLVWVAAAAVLALGAAFGVNKLKSRPHQAEALTLTAPEPAPETAVVPVAPVPKTPTKAVQPKVKKRRRRRGKRRVTRARSKTKTKSSKRVDGFALSGSPETKTRTIPSPTDLTRLRQSVDEIIHSVHDRHGSSRAAPLRNRMMAIPMSPRSDAGRASAHRSLLRLRSQARRARDES